MKMKNETWSIFLVPLQDLPGGPASIVYGCRGCHGILPPRKKGLAGKTLHFVGAERTHNTRAQATQRRWLPNHLLQ